MSFSGQVKEELSRHIHKSRHCQIAEIAAVLGFAGKLEEAGGESVLRVYTENLPLGKYFPCPEIFYPDEKDIPGNLSDCCKAEYLPP